MDPAFTVSARIARPIEEVYEAVADPGRLSGYFTTGGATGRLERGATVTWDFADHPGAFPVEVVEAEKPHRIVLRWDAEEPDCAPGGRTTVTIAFEPIDDGRRTLVTISESGWTASPAGYRSSYRNCGGWMQMLCAMKAWVEHGLNLREGMYR